MKQRTMSRKTLPRATAPTAVARSARITTSLPKFLDDFDLTKATKPVAEFVAEKGSPTEAMDRYIVVAVWLKEHMSVEEFDINQIYSVFKHLGWLSSMPNNHSQPLRDLKTKRHFLTKEKSHGYKLNWAGFPVR